MSNGGQPRLRLNAEEYQLIMKLRETGARVAEPDSLAPLMNPDDALALPEEVIEDLAPYEAQGTRALIMGDIHIPFHSTMAITEAMRAGRKFGADLIVLNGDVIDNYALSRHLPKRQSRRSIDYEVSATRQFLEAVRNWFPHANVVYKFGNHENRYDTMILQNAPALENSDYHTLHEWLGLSSYGMQYVEHWRQIRLGKLNIFHGHEIMASGVNPSRNVILKAIDNVIVNHVHKTGETAQRRVNGEYLGGWSVGCLCHLNPAWLPVNQWNHGYALVEHDTTTGNFVVENRRIL